MTTATLSLTCSACGYPQTLVRFRGESIGPARETCAVRTCRRFRKPLDALWRQPTAIEGVGIPKRPAHWPRRGGL